MAIKVATPKAQAELPKTTRQHPTSADRAAAAALRQQMIDLGLPDPVSGDAGWRSARYGWARTIASHRRRGFDWPAAIELLGRLQEVDRQFWPSLTSPQDLARKRAQLEQLLARRRPQAQLGRTNEELDELIAELEQGRAS